MQITSHGDIGSRLLTENEAAEKLNVALRTIIDWRNRGLVPFVRIARSIRYRPESLQAMLEKLEIGGAH